MARTITASGDDAKASESTGFALWPDGDYIGEIIDVTAVKFGKPDSASPNRNKPAMNIKVRFTESGTGVGVGKKFVAWQIPDFEKFESGSSAFLFYQFYKAVGVEFPKAGETADVELPDHIDLLGQEIGLKISIEKGTGTYKDKNKVAAFFPASKGVEVKAPKEADEEFDLG